MKPETKRYIWNIFFFLIFITYTGLMYWAGGADKDMKNKTTLDNCKVVAYKENETTNNLIVKIQCED